MRVLISLVAFAAGILTGLGAGGGSFLIPALVLLFGIAQHAAQAATLVALIPVSLAAALSHHRRGFVRPGYVWRMGLGSALGAAAGAVVATHMKAPTLRSVFGVYLIIIAVYTLLRPGAAGD